MRVALVSLVLATVASGSAQTVLLRYNPPVGKTASYTMRMSMSTTLPQGASVSGKPMSFTQTTPMSLRVLAHAGGATTIETRSGPMKFDAPAGSPMAAGAKNPNLAKVNVVRMTIDEFGTPKGASGGGASAAVVNAMGSAMGQGGQGVTFPKAPVKVGDTWKSSLDIGKMIGAAGAGLKANGTIPLVFRLLAVKGGEATVSMTAKGSVGMNVGGRTLNFTMDLKSTSLIDTATGLTRSTSTTMDSVTSMPGMTAMRQHMVSTLK